MPPKRRPVTRSWTFVILGLIIDAVCLYLAATAQSNTRRFLFLYGSLIGMTMAISYYQNQRGIFSVALF